MSVRSRRQVRRLRLDTPYLLQPPVHNAEVAVRKRMSEAWRTPWADFDIRPAVAAMAVFTAAMVRVQQVFASTAAAMEDLRGRFLWPVDEVPAASAFRATPAPKEDLYRRYFLGEWVSPEVQEQVAVDYAEAVGSMGVPRRVVFGFDPAGDYQSVVAFEVAEDDR